MQKKRKNLLTGIQKKIFGCYFLMMGILTLIIIVLFSFLVKKETNNQSDNRTSMVSRVSSQLDMSLINMDRVALQVIGDNVVLKTFESIADHGGRNYFEYHIPEKMDLQSILLNINGPKLMVGRISLYNQYGDYVSYGKYNETGTLTMPSAAQENYFSVFNLMTEQEVKKYFRVHKDSWENKGQQILSLYRPIKNSVTGKISGMVEVQTYLDEVFQFINFDDTGLYSIAIYDDKYTYIYANEENIQKDDVRRESILEMEKAREMIYKSGNIAISKTPEYGWFVVLEQMNPDLVFGLSRFLAVVLGMIILVVIGTVFMMFLISKRLTAPLVELTHLLKKVKMSNLSVVLEDEDETDMIKELNRAFSVMFLQLNRAIENETRINLRILQSQMDPHFLYNVLTVIKAAAYEEKSTQVPVLCDRLSEMLRYSSSYQDISVSLNQEIKYAENYCELMKARYEDLLDFRIIRHGPADKVRVPKLIIQPLVENCFRHGFAQKEGMWSVSIDVEAGDGRWRVEVRDNGTGFEEQQKEEIRKMVQDWENQPGKLESVSGIGLRNTIMRLYLFYKEDFIYEIHSDGENGTAVIIGGPQEEYGEDDKSTDSRR